jgi:hypothetical protein
MNRDWASSVDCWREKKGGDWEIYRSMELAALKILTSPVCD